MEQAQVRVEEARCHDRWERTGGCGWAIHAERPATLHRTRWPTISGLGELRDAAGKGRRVLAFPVATHSGGAVPGMHHQRWLGTGSSRAPYHALLEAALS